MRFFFLLLFVFSSAFLSAQVKSHSSDSKAIKLFEKGLDAYRDKENEEAKKFLLSSVVRDPNYYEAWDLLSRVYYESGDKKASLDALYTMVKIDPNERPSDYYYIALLEKEFQHYEEAIAAYDEYLNRRDDNFELMELAVRAKDDCEFAIWAMKHPVPYEPVNLGPMINTEDPEYLPCLTADDQLLLFTRRIKDPRSAQGMQDNLYYTTKDEEQNWVKAEAMDDVNSVLNEGAASISADGNTLVFTACSFYGDYGPGRQGLGSCDLFISTKKGNGWSEPINLGANINSANWESQPSLSSDGNTLYFIRAPKRRDKEANQEIYVAKKDKNGEWLKATKLSSTINTPHKEETVLIHPDGHTLYFSSNGHPGMGGLDIFMSRKDENGNWGEVKNLGYPINTPNDENSLLVSTDGKLAYFSTNMDTGYGSFDLYSFELYPEARPLAVTYMKGKVFDKESTEALNARFELIDLSNGEVVFSSHSDEITGGFLIPITSGKDYALNVEKDGYLFFSENFQMKKHSSSDEPFMMNVPLMKIEVGSELVLKNVFFETDEYVLKPESKVELNKLITFLDQNESVRLEVEGHTDDQGNATHNRELSTQRAKSVYGYLIDNGIAKERLTFKGYAADRPIADNSTDEGRALNRRTSVQIIAK